MALVDWVDRPASGPSWGPHGTLRTSSDLSYGSSSHPALSCFPPSLISRPDALLFPAIYTFFYFLLYLSFDQASPGSCSIICTTLLYH